MPILTGNIRLRSTLFNRLVLQVEEAYLDFDKLGLTGVRLYQWRDAKIADLGNIDINNIMVRTNIDE